MVRVDVPLARPHLRARALDREAADLPSLLVEWLGELVFLAESDGFVPERVTEMGLAGGRLQAVVAGQRATPQALVKGVTYHRLEFAQDGESAWHARVVLDV